MDIVRKSLLAKNKLDLENTKTLTNLYKNELKASSANGNVTNERLCICRSIGKEPPSICSS